MQYILYKWNEKRTAIVTDKERERNKFSFKIPPKLLLPIIFNMTVCVVWNFYVCVRLFFLHFDLLFFSRYRLFSIFVCRYLILLSLICVYGYCQHKCHTFIALSMVHIRLINRQKNECQIFDYRPFQQQPARYC